MDQAGPSGPFADLSEEGRGEVAARLIATASQFELRALVALLGELGFGPDRLLLRSAYTQASPDGLIHDLCFLPRRMPRTGYLDGPMADPLGDPEAVAVISLNIGLTGPQSPLPSHLLELAADPRVDDEALLGFLNFLDHLSLTPLMEANRADVGPRRLRGLDATFGMLDHTAPAQVHWLFASLYPELSVTVRRRQLERRVDMGEFVLGRSELGESYAFGGRTAFAVPGFEVVLSADEHESLASQAWPAEATRRLHRSLLPLLSGSDLVLRVALEFPGPGGSLVLGGEKRRMNQGGLLGFEPFAHDEGEVLHLVLFHGSTLSTTPAGGAREEVNAV